MPETPIGTEMSYNRMITESHFEEMFDLIIKQFESMAGRNVTFDVTRRRLVLGARDSETRQRAKSYQETTIPMIILPRGSRYLHLAPGVFITSDAVGLTIERVTKYDQIRTPFDVYYEVKDVKDEPFGDTLLYRQCDLTLLPLQEWL